AAPQVRAPDAAGKEGVTGKKLRCSQLNFADSRRQEKTGASRRMTWCVHHLRMQMAPAENIAIAEHLVNLTDRGRRNAEKGGLLIHSVIKRQIGAVHQDGGTGVRVELLQAAHVVNVRVCADDRFYGEFVAADEIHDSADFVARIEHERFACGRIADDRTVALKHANRQREMYKA